MFSENVVIEDILRQFLSVDVDSELRNYFKRLPVLKLIEWLD